MRASSWGIGKRYQNKSVKFSKMATAFTSAIGKTAFTGKAVRAERAARPKVREDPFSVADLVARAGGD